MVRSDFRKAPANHNTSKVWYPSPRGEWGGDTLTDASCGLSHPFHIGQFEPSELMLWTGDWIVSLSLRTSALAVSGSILDFHMSPDAAKSTARGELAIENGKMQTVGRTPQGGGREVTPRAGS